jgi:hypothetical protein
VILFVIGRRLMCWVGVLGRRCVVVGSGRHGWGVGSAAPLFIMGKAWRAVGSEIRCFGGACKNLQDIHSIAPHPHTSLNNSVSKAAPQSQLVAEYTGHN